MVTDSWPQQKNQIKNIEEAAYFEHRFELKVVEDCLFRGNQIVIPAKLRQHILQELNEGHPGECRMKLFAADKVFWPYITTH